MSGDLVTTYAAELRARLAALPGADLARLTALVDAATALRAAIDSAAPTKAAIDAAAQQWATARAAIANDLPKVLLGPLSAVPGLAELAANLGDVARTGIHGSAQVGPVRLDVASATLVVQPKLPDGTLLAPIEIGPYAIGQIAASLSSPFGGGKGLPGGGAIVRLPDDSYGGTLQLPLGPVQVSAAAVLGVRDGQPSFLAVMGAAFTPPIQLSFGFSLDRVGGIVGVHRRSDSDALGAAVRTGTAGDALFATRPPASPLALVATLDRLFPANRGTHLVGPSLGLAWLSSGEQGHLLGLDVAVVVQIPTGKVIVVGVARASVPGLPQVLNLRMDLLGIVDPVERTVSVDASLVDSHVLGIFEVYGDAAMRLSWGTTGYAVVTVGGFYPGYDPEPARLPALRQVGLSLDSPVSLIDIRAEGYFAVTTNTLQFGGRLEIGFDKGIEAHGFVQVDALIQFRPFHFRAKFSAGFRVGVAGHTFASVGLDGSISGPGPITIDGSLSIRVFLFKISWHESFTIGHGPADTLPTPPDLLPVVKAELDQPSNTHAGSGADPDVVLRPRPGRATVAAVPPTGTLVVSQRRVPLGVLVERVDGRPLAGPRGAVIATPGRDATERFAPGAYVNLTDAEALHRPPFDVLCCGRELTPPDPGPSGPVEDKRLVDQIVIHDNVELSRGNAARHVLDHVASLVDAAGKPPALSDTTPLVTALPEAWTATGSPFANATAAHQHARHHGGVALSVADAANPITLAGVL
ncbi:DUF6603 domain-containing protein [Longispora sp. K20-0274]|uniref:DUF6603 domain-containing protein n=1 Tax=Longispora sp. K20-0274 TaxID=3088255 RepID=UPI0039995DBB